MLSVGAASFAILLDLYAIRIIAFVLHRRVVAALALAARERDDDSVVLLGHCSVLEWAAELPRGQIHFAFHQYGLEKRRQKKLPPGGWQKISISNR